MAVKGHSFATLRTWLRITHLVRIWRYLLPVVHQVSPQITNPSRFYHTRGHYPGLVCTTPPLKEVLTPAFFPSFDAPLVEKALGTPRNLTMLPDTPHALRRPTSMGFCPHFPHGSSLCFRGCWHQTCPLIVTRETV